MNRCFNVIAIAFVLLTIGCIPVLAASADEYWPAWRGPGGTGVSPHGQPPVTWSEAENIKWKVKLEGDPSGASPIVWAEKIFFQEAVKTDVRAANAPTSTRSRRGPGGTTPANVYRFDVVCLDRNTGKQLWRKTVREELPHEGHHRDHGFASFTPATDGKLLWANFGSRGVHCLDLEGNPKWSRDLGKMNTRNAFGEGGSLALAGDTLVVVRDHEGDSSIVALNKGTGEILWQRQRDEPSAWSTPVPVEVNGKTQIVASAANFIRSYDLETGETIWQCGGMTLNVVPTPVVGLGMVFCASGFRGSSLQAIELGHTGDLTETDAIKWHVDKATPYVPSPLLYGERLYVFAVNTAALSCYNAKTGEPYFVRERLEKIRGVYASPVAAAGRIYLAGRNGVTYVLQDSEKLEVLAVNTLDDGFDASPAVVGNEMLLKGKAHLYCIAE